jgi:hypothetical protein
MPFSEMQASGRPDPDQIEVCVFGPNYGECVVVHLGNGIGLSSTRASMKESRWQWRTCKLWDWIQRDQ